MRKVCRDLILSNQLINVTNINSKSLVEDSPGSLFYLGVLTSSPRLDFLASLARFWPGWPQAI